MQTFPRVLARVKLLMSSGKTDWPWLWSVKLKDVVNQEEFLAEVVQFSFIKENFAWCKRRGKKKKRIFHLNFSGRWSVPVVSYFQSHVCHMSEVWEWGNRWELFCPGSHMESVCSRERHWNLQVWKGVYLSSELVGETQIFLFSVWKRKSRYTGLCHSCRPCVLSWLNSLVLRQNHRNQIK